MSSTSRRGRTGVSLEKQSGGGRNRRIPPRHRRGQHRSFGALGHHQNQQPFEAVKVILEEAAGAEAMALEKGMIVLSTAVAGGPFIGLLGTVWGVMSTFAGIAESKAASLRPWRPVWRPRWSPPSPACSSPSRRCSPITSWSPPSAHITQELDGFASRYANQIEHAYVDHRPTSRKKSPAH